MITLTLVDKVTKDNYTKVFVNPAHIGAITPSKGHTNVLVQGHMYSVKESFQKIGKLIKQS